MGSVLFSLEAHVTAADRGTQASCLRLTRSVLSYIETHMTAADRGTQAARLRSAMRPNNKDRHIKTAGKINHLPALGIIAA